ncbi:pyocin activator PrtN family protein [bacterium]|nr:pyocin activator PrtN family protein [bacterium]
MRKLNEHAIALPIVSIEASQKSAKGVYLQDLADYLNVRRAEGQREFRQMYG